MICPACNYDNLPGSEVCERCLQDLSQLDLPTAQDRVQRSLMEDPVSVLGPHQPITVRAGTSLREAMATMLAENIGTVLVLDDSDKLIGILSERDLLTKMTLTPGEEDRLVSDFMTPFPETVLETDPLAFVLHKMDSGGYRHLPVLAGGKVSGVISVRDMLRHFTRLCKGHGHGN
jgi:CBS domain-containing protein